MLLDIKNLDISYGERLTVADVSFQLNKGEILSIVGESGSGKTTVIRAIMGCLAGVGRVSGGDMVFEGRSLLKNTKEEWRAMSGHDISMIFQDSGTMINPIRTIGKQFVEYIMAHDKSVTKDQAYTMAVNMLTKVRLPNADNIMRSYPFELSGGMRQRVGIAMAMVFSPKILLADEPTSALDVTIQAQIVRQIVDIRNEYDAAVIIVTHNLGVASYMSNKIMVMQKGKVVESGTRDEIINNPQHPYTKQLLAAVPVIGGKRYYGE